jgi:regulator of protease activity HflC (stomatin/prohibitin superfamily)
MNRWRRAAGLNKNVIIALIVLALVALIFWGFQCHASRQAEQDALETLTGRPRVLIDTETGESYRIPFEEAQKLPTNEEGMVQVPATGQFTGEWHVRRPTVIEVDDDLAP